MSSYYVFAALLVFIVTADAAGNVTVNTNPVYYYGSILANWSSTWQVRPTTIRNSWVRGHNPCQPKWPGVTCGKDTKTNMSVLTSIKLPSVAVGTPLPVSLSVISTLTELVLSGAQMKGSLPTAWVKGFPLLQKLVLSGNNIMGTLPAEWASPGALPRLKVLQLDSNQLSGTLPPSWGGPGSFQQLQALDVSGNQLWGPLPDTAWAQKGSLPKLHALDLSSNQLTGTLTTEWSTALTGLTSLDLTTNQIGGGLPESWAAKGAFPALARLRLGDNQFSGSLPDTWAVPATLPALTELRLGSNILTGTLPVAWGAPAAFPRLALLDIRSNQITGDLPPSWGVPPMLTAAATRRALAAAAQKSKPSFAVLRALDLSNNQLTSALPAEWGTPGAWPKLQQLALDGNDLGLASPGPIPDTWLSTSPRALPSLLTLALYPGNTHICGGDEAGWGNVTWQVVNTQEPEFGSWNASQKPYSSGLDDFHGLPPSPPSNSSLLLNIDAESVMNTSEGGLPKCPSDDGTSSSDSSSSSSDSFSGSGWQYSSTSGEQYSSSSSFESSSNEGDEGSSSSGEEGQA